MTRIRILADDLTGALDTAAVFCGRIPVFIDQVPGACDVYADAPVAVVSTATRNVPQQTLPQRLAPLLPWFWSGTLCFKKIDSLIRGNTFDEIAWLFTQGKFDQAIFAPAFPEQGRITKNGQHYLSRQSTLAPIGQNLQQTFADHRLTSALSLDEKANVLIPDILAKADLSAIAERHERYANLLWCGSAGLARALATASGLVSKQQEPTRLAPRKGPTILVTASYHPVLREQWKNACEAGRGWAAIAGAPHEEMLNALTELQRGARTALFNLSPQQQLADPVKASQLLAEQLTFLFGQIPEPGQLIVIGGDTLVAICRILEAKTLLAQASGRNGWGCAQLAGGKYDGVPCYSRSGAFGMPDDLTVLLNWLQYE